MQIREPVMSLPGEAGVLSAECNIPSRLARQARVSQLDLAGYGISLFMRAFFLPPHAVSPFSAVEEIEK